MPREHAFRFLHADPNGPVTQSLSQFYTAVATVPPSSLRYHLLAGDFSRWVADIIADPALAAGLRKLECTTRAGAAASREEILRHIADRYLVP